MKVCQKVLLKKQKREDRKNGHVASTWLLHSAWYLREVPFIFEKYGWETTENEIQYFAVRTILGFRRRKNSC